MQGDNIAKMDREQKLRWQAEMQRQAELNETFSKQMAVGPEFYLKILI